MTRAPKWSCAQPLDSPDDSPLLANAKRGSLGARLLVWLLVASAVSCSHQRRHELVSTLAGDRTCGLDSTRAQTMLGFMRRFPNESEVSVAILTDDSTSFFGVKRRNDSLICVDNKAGVFEIGSVTKTFTATILAKMVRDGAVELQAPIQRFLPIALHQSSLNGKEVTLLQLANHTSGLPKEPDNIGADLTVPGSPYRDYDESKLYDYLSKRMTLQSTPGERREYSNLGGGLLGHLLALIAGKPYEDLLRETICEPLGLQSTFVALSSDRMRHLVPGRDPNGRVIPNWELNVLAGGGGMKSTAEDMAKYVRACINDTTFYLLTQQPTIWYTEHNAAGLGWAWYADGNRKYVSATGGTGGYSCCVIFERSRRTGIVVLTNVSAFLASKNDDIVKLSRALGDPLIAAR